MATPIDPMHHEAETRPQEPVAQVNRDLIYDELAKAYIAGCQAVQESWQPDTEPDFKEAGYDYATGQTEAVLLSLTSPPGNKELVEAAREFFSAKEAWDGLSGSGPRQEDEIEAIRVRWVNAQSGLRKLTCETE